MSGAYTPQVQEGITRLGSRLPFGEARDELALLWGVKISSGGVRHITLRHGQIADELIEQEVPGWNKKPQHQQPSPSN